MTAALFLGFLAITAVVVVSLCACYLPRRTTMGVLMALPAWLLYVGLLGYFGAIGNAPGRPPGIAFILVPVFLFIGVVLVRSSAGARVALAFPLPVLVGMQGFRIGVELFLHRLWIEGLAPRTLTFEGSNVDILIGASAPLVAWLSTRGRPGRELTLAWNALGLLALANVVVRSALTAPGPFNIIHAEIPNRAISTFPFMFIPGFFAPLAVSLHILAIRASIPGSGGRQKQRSDGS